MPKLDGKVALVTGGTSEIGLAAATAVAKEGAYVYITGRRERELATAVQEIGRNATGVQGDVSNTGDLDRLFAQIPGRVRLSGEFRSGHVHQVKTEKDQCGSPGVLHLEEVDLVDVEAIHFLNSCEEQGVSVLNASAYIEKWMVRERERPAH
jgi:NAD(P)-dependent dehydrogenase (short-subunit alcohol dehydrogenase family)